MLPMIVVRRFDCLLDNYNREIIKEVYNTYDFMPEDSTFVPSNAINSFPYNPKSIQ